MPEPVQVFISHSTQNLDRVLAIKAELLSYAINSFVAHEDINPSEEWAERILTELRRCDVFMPIITDAFRNSLWCDQETGYAVSRTNLTVLPVSVDNDPYGLIARYQAIRLRGAIDEQFVARLVTALGRQAHIHIKMKSAMIERFQRADSFLEAKQAFARLTTIAGFSRDELDNMLQIACGNSQIYNYGGARGCMEELLEATATTGTPSPNSLAGWERRLRGQ